MTIYVTKYVVAGDILKVENHDEPKDGRVTYRTGVTLGLQFAWQGDWFPTLAAAREDAERRINKKIKSLRRQADALATKAVKVKEV